MPYATLAAIVVAAFLFRALLLWVTRPEFVGWFNHSYYYWVQVRGILDTGQMPFDDLPLLFYLYAALAAVLQSIGLDSSAAIVNATRALMSITPALVAVPVFWLVRDIGTTERLDIRQWTLVGVAAFLPLTIAHMPEMLQKNAMGLLLLSGLMLAAYRMLQARSRNSLIAAICLFILIALTHLGTLAVALLFLLALLVACAIDGKDKSRLVIAAAISTGGGVASLIALRVFDPGALGRALQYFQSSLSNSLLANVVTAGSTALMSAVMVAVVIPALLAWLLLRSFRTSAGSLAPADRVFRIASLVFAYLLVLPLFHVDVLPRFVLFMPLPVAVLVAYYLRLGSRNWLKTTIVGMAAAGAVMMTLGETMSVLRLYPDKDEVHAELIDAREALQLGENDFVLTQYAVNPICNWFLRTPSGLVTAFNRHDAELYERVFVLNLPQARAMSDDTAVGDVMYRSGAERYQAMRQNIFVPASWLPVNNYDKFALYEVESLPAEWLFDGQGDWVGYRRSR